MKAILKSWTAPLARLGRKLFWTAPKMSWTRLRLGLGVTPLSYRWGGDRGFPIHRYYLARFFQEFANDVRGHCLEFQEPWYCAQFGQDRVTKVDVLHVDDTNPKATIVADLTKPNNVPGNQFDCIVCTHVLHIIFELSKIVAELHRLLKPGGVLLVGVPHVSMCDPSWHEIWRFTPEGLHRALADSFGWDNVTPRGYGNALTAAGQIRGLVVQDFLKSELDYHDDRFAVEVCARAVKSPGGANGHSGAFPASAVLPGVAARDGGGAPP